jgi:NADH:ubiquinone reductase (H+-translocating)
MRENIVILGGGYGGAMAAARIAKRGIPVTLIDAGDGLTERIRLHQVAAGDDIAPVPFARLFRDLPVRTIKARVMSIDRARKQVLTTAGEVAYDKLVYALGSIGDSREGAVTLNNPRALRDRLRTARSMAIVGAGLTGIELASEIAERHPHVELTLVDAGKLGRALSPHAQRHLHEWMSEHRVRVVENTRVEDVESLGADVVVWAGAFRVSDIARNAGLRVNERGQIAVDEHLRSSDPSIFAIGDAAFCEGYRMSCAVALPMGAYVADYLTGATTGPFRFAFVIQCISLGRHDGIIQFVHPDDSPKERALTGRPAAWVKELVCRYTTLSLRMGFAA